jgi:antitoxin (DNA-binding transcriptional repressor) of toxin-antitoxin stability system
VVVTSRGKPTAVLHAVTEDDLEDYLLANSTRFVRGLKASYREYQRTKGVSFEQLMTDTEHELNKLHD